MHIAFVECIFGICNRITNSCKGVGKSMSSDDEVAIFEVAERDLISRVEAIRGWLLIQRADYLQWLLRTQGVGEDSHEPLKCVMVEFALAFRRYDLVFSLKIDYEN